MLNKIYIYPTDTVWGIGGDYRSQEIHNAIHFLKGRDEAKATSILFNDYLHVKNFFYWPVSWKENNNLEILKELFLLEATLCLPKSWVKNSLPHFLAPESLLIGVRCLPFDFLKKIESPLTTTSLNLSGQSACTSLPEARIIYNDFLQKLKKSHWHEQVELEFIEVPELLPSGVPSTVLSYDGKSLQILRQGKNWEKILHDTKLFIS